MRPFLMLMGICLMSGVSTLAIAQPPALNAVYDFTDPVLGAVVLCDTEQQIKDIASAPVPASKFAELYGTPNSEGIPTCISGTFQAEVLAVDPLGVMVFDGDSFQSWAVEVGTPDQHAFALYLEKVQSI